MGDCTQSMASAVSAASTAFFKFLERNRELVARVAGAIRPALLRADHVYPDRHGGYDYFVSKSSDSELCTYMRRKLCESGKHGDPELLLDEIAICKSSSALAVNLIRVSPDHRWVVVTADHTMQEHYTAYIRKITPYWQRKPAWNIAISGIYSVVFSACNAPQSLFYTKVDDVGRPYAVMRRIIEEPDPDSKCEAASSMEGPAPSDAAGDELVLHVDDDTKYTDLTTSKDHRYVIININDYDTSSLYLVDSAHHSAPVQAQLIQPVTQNVQCFVEHAHSTLFVLTNARSQDFSVLQVSASVLTCPKSQPALASRGITAHPEAVEVISTQPGRTIVDMEVFDTGLVVYFNLQGDPAVRWYPFHQPDVPRRGGCVGLQQPFDIVLPTAAFRVQPGPGNVGFDSTLGHLQVEFIDRPKQVYEFPLTVEAAEAAAAAYPSDPGIQAEGMRLGDDTAPGRRILAKPASLDLTENHSTSTVKTRLSDRSKQQAILQATTPPRQVHTLWSPASDGVHVPVKLLSSADDDMCSIRPTLLQVYGAYGYMNEMEHQPWFDYLLDDGWRLGWVHIRGGGELGSRWRSGARAGTKYQSYDDFVTAVQHLKSMGLVLSSQLAARGMSAGALPLAWAAVNHPSLVAAYILRVPFVNALSPMLNPALPLTIPEWREWGMPLMSHPSIHDAHPDHLTTIVDPATPRPSAPTAGGLDIAHVDRRHYERAALYSLSPRHTIPTMGGTGPLPHVLMIAGDSDPRVPADICESFVDAWVKWSHARRNPTAAVRDHPATDREPTPGGLRGALMGLVGFSQPQAQAQGDSAADTGNLLYRVHEGAGHFGEVGVDSRAMSAAEEIAFLKATVRGGRDSGQK